MSACTSSATATSVGTFTTQTQTVTQSQSVITQSSRVTTIISTGCNPTITGVCSSVQISTVSTIPGGVITTQVPLTVTIDAVATRTTTLFGTTCSQVGGSNSNSNSNNNNPVVDGPTTNEGNNQPANPGPSASTTTRLVTSTTKGGATAGVTGSTGTSSNQGGSSSKSSNANVGPIVGGVIGGIVGLAAIVFLIIFLLKRRSKNWDDIFDKEDDDIVAAGAAKAHQ